MTHNNIVNSTKNRARRQWLIGIKKKARQPLASAFVPFRPYCPKNNKGGMTTQELMRFFRENNILATAVDGGYYVQCQEKAIAA